MLGNLFLKTLRDQRRGLTGWSIGLVLLVLVESALWPSVSDMPNLEQFLEGYPEPMRELFNIEAITTGQGFMNAELFSLLLPALFIIYAIGRGVRLIAGEEEAGTLEILLVTPLSTAGLLLQKLAALAVSVAALGAVLFVSLVGCSAAFDVGISAGAAATGSLAMVLIGLEHGCLALAVGAITGRRGLAITVAGSVAVAGYVLYVAALFVDAMADLQPLSPFYQALADGPLGAGLPLRFIWMPLAAVALVLVALPVFDRRDVATAR